MDDPRLFPPGTIWHHDNYSKQLWITLDDHLAHAVNKIQIDSFGCRIGDNAAKKVSLKETLKRLDLTEIPEQWKKTLIQYSKLHFTMKKQINKVDLP